MDKILVLEEADSEAGIAYLSEGAGAPSMLLIISWCTIAEANQGMDGIMRCGAWQVVAEDSTLMIVGQGSTVLLSGETACAVFSAVWEMDDPYVVSLFAQMARTNGYFLLLPAVNKIPRSGPPVPCYLGGEL